MRVGLFVALLGALFAVLAITVPVAGDFPPLSSAGVASAPPATRCLSLAYEPATGGRWLPATLRLTSDTAALFDRPPRARAYRAEGGPEDGPGSFGYRFAAWRPAGSDSVDIAWHHSPIIRLPVRRGAHGDTLVGRAGAWSYPSLYDAVVRRESLSVRAVEHGCPRVE